MEWISVEERLPETDIEVLVSGEGIVCTGNLFRGHLWNVNATGMQGNPTHWMPLPEAPK